MSTTAATTTAGASTDVESNSADLTGTAVTEVPFISAAAVGSTTAPTGTATAAVSNSTASAAATPATIAATGSIANKSGISATSVATATATAPNASTSEANTAVASLLTDEMTTDGWDSTTKYHVTTIEVTAQGNSITILSAETE